jgi:predicted GNAT superfamily acetyltransferase
VHWRLNAPAVRRASRGHAPPGVDAADLPPATATRIPASRRVAVEVPAGAPELYSTHPEAARRAQRSLRRIATRLFDRGYEATAVAAGNGGARYVFERA